jgi:hydroxymethylpyrimidine kinase/phosphomethylpyrimidine kinase
VAAKAKKAVAMTVAGSDPSGGAGLQADLKTFAALDVHGFSIVTAIIAQNSACVARVVAVDADLVAAQIETVVAEWRPDSLKTGALASAAIIDKVADLVRRLHLPAPVIDPVLISSSGARLLEADSEQRLCERLLPLARIVTPNIPEAEALSGIAIDGPVAMRAAARAIRRMGVAAVVIKGGHPFSGSTGAPSRKIVDLFYEGRSFIELSGTRIAGGGAHGTGCAFSAAIAAYLARGMDLETAVRRARTFVTRAMRAGFVLGGRPLLDHFARP